MSRKELKTSPSDASGDCISTRIITNQQLLCDGAPFKWWAVGENPTLVTVRSPVFGGIQDVTQDDAEAFAMALAKQVLDRHYARAERAREQRHEPDADQTAADSPDALNKAGWFETQ